MDPGTVLYVIFAVTLILSCQASERDPAYQRVMRWVVVFITLFFTINGVLELAGGAGGQGLRSSLGLSGSSGNLISAGALDAGLSGLALLLFGLGTAGIPGLAALRQGRPISWLALALFFHGLAANLAPGTAAATVTATAGSPERAGDLILNGIPFGVIAIAAVGPVVRRSAGESLRRLGLTPLRPPWWAVGIGLGLLLVLAGGPIIDLLLQHLTPADCLAQQDAVSRSLQGEGRSALEQVGIALSAGICEELLFRGALQPRVGIVLASLLWATFHLQYSCHGLPAVGNLYILVLGFLFGGLRARGGLLAAIAAHVAYDAAILLGLSDGQIALGATAALALGAILRPIFPSRPLPAASDG